MARLKKVFSAGRREASTRSDCYVEIDVKSRGGVSVFLESKVGSLYGSSISALAKDVCAAIGLHHAHLRIIDQGALPYVLAARIEVAVKRALPSNIGEYLTGTVTRKKLLLGKDRPRRSRLYLPGDQPKFFVNAGLHGPDVIILDLEDSVAPEEKDAARLLVRNALRSVDFFDAERSVRINQGRPGLDDLRTVVSGKPDLILIPKCEDAETVTVVANELRSLERLHHVGREILLLPIIESALGVVNAYAIASSSARICGLAIGLEDYTADIGVERTAEGKESLFARMSVVNAAKAAGVQALDSVYADVDDPDGLRQSTLEARSLGFEGKGCIHPRQVAVIHSAFAPTEKEIERAREIVRVAEDARKNSSGVIALGSKMVDAPVVLRAERVLRLAERFGEEGGVS